MLTVDVKDPAGLAKTIGRIESTLVPPGPMGPPAPTTRPAEPRASRPRRPGPTIESIKFARSDIHYLALPSNFSPIPVAPAWTLHKKRLLVALWPQVIESAVAANGQTKPLIKSAEFRSARTRIAGKPSILVYCNGPKIVRQLYHWGLIGWTLAANQLAAGNIREARPDWLPPLSTVEQYLRPSIVAVCPDATGITIESYSSLPGLAPAAGVLLNPAIFWLDIPAGKQMRQLQDEF